MNGNAEQMAEEARAIAARHADILKEDSPLAPPVIVTIPADLSDQSIEVMVRHEYGGVLVDVRAASHHAWTPVSMILGASVEVRSA